MVARSLVYSLHNGTNNGTILEEQTIEQSLKSNNDPIFIYYADNHFQALIPKS